MSLTLKGFVVLSIAALSTAQAPDLLVTVEQGTLRGAVVASALGSPYAAFRGVPYATPPVGELRFQPPQPAASWTGVRDALEEERPCTQVAVGPPIGEDPGDEDCLYLNIYMPLNASAAAPAPVLVWVPGGAFILGSGTANYYGPDLLLENGVAVVAINYRLGALGFLSTEDDVIPGNFGMKDQLLALQWLQRNIAAFGGDPDRITVGGESAGGCSVSHHFVSPASAGLFSGVVMQSGDATAPFGIMRNARDKAFRLAEVLGFQTNDSAELLNFLRTQDAADLVAHDVELLSEQEQLGLSRLAWMPVLERESEDAFITEMPADNIKAGRFNRVNVLQGVTSGDGIILLDAQVGKPYLEDPSVVRQLSDNFVAAIAPALHLPTAAQREEAALRLRQFYFGRGEITLDDAQALVNMSTDLNFAEPTDSRMRIVANASDSINQFYYLFDYRGSELNNNTYGTWHADETVVLFLQNGEAAPDPGTVFGNMSYNLVRLWSNFITYGTPSPPGETIVWLPFSNSNLNYLHITDEFHMEQNINRERMDFWHQYIPM